jgi:hypothetical protein
MQKWFHFDVGADWSVTDLAELVEEAAPKPSKGGPYKEQAA